MPGTTIDGDASPGPRWWFSSDTPAGGHRHQVFLYHDAAEYVEVVGAFVRAGLDAGERVHVAVPGELVAQVQAALPDTGETVTYADVLDVGRNPARLLAQWRRFLDEADGSPCRGVGESVHRWLDADQLDESLRHERILNVAFDGHPLLLLCPYDVTALDDDVVDHARASHPLVLESGRSGASGAFRSDGLLDGHFLGPLAPAPAGPGLRFDRTEMAGLRRFVAGRASAAGAGDRVDDLVLAAGEIATNVVTHGGEGGIARCWTDGDWMVCEVEGPGTITDPLAGRVHPDPSRPDGRGLWLANQLCDLVQIRSTDTGSVVRLRVRIPVGAA